MRIALIGDGDSPHLLKWAGPLAGPPDVWLGAAPSRGSLPAFDGLVPDEPWLALHRTPDHAGGNADLLRSLPRLGRWLRKVDADWLNPHYLTSHGTLAWLARRGWRLRARIVGSAWGSDILVTPERSAVYRALTRRVLRACAVCTSDSSHMTGRMQALGASEVMTFPFGLETLPAATAGKDPWLFFANRGLEPIYRPERVLVLFAELRRLHPDARLVVANGGSLRASLEQQARETGLADAVTFTGRLDAATQSRWYDLAQWYVSLPESDSVSVSVLEAMAHGCVPLLSDLPANRELVRDGDNGLIVLDPAAPPALDPLRDRALAIAAANRDWVSRNALFQPAVGRLLDRLKDFPPA